MSVPLNTECVCGKKIDFSSDYVSKGDFNFCSDECAEKPIHEELKQNPPVTEVYIGEWPPAAVPL